MRQNQLQQKSCPLHVKMMKFQVAHPGKAAIAVDVVVIDDAVAEDEDAWIARMSAECVAQ